MIGYDIHNKYVQISYYNNTTSQPESVSTIAGSEKFQIPLTLCKLKEKDVWYYGEEAVKAAESGEGTLIEDLFLRCLGGRSIQIEGERYEGTQLFARFLKKTLRLTPFIDKKEELFPVVFTLENPDFRSLYILDKAIEQLSIDKSLVTVQSHKDSFYYYMKYQKRELWNFETVLFEYTGEFKCCHLIADHRNIPKKVQITEIRYDSMKREIEGAGKQPEEAGFQKLDRLFFEIIEKEFKGRNISSVYLIGEIFDKKWMKQSLQLLCRGRRVFQGNNLYTKGACYAAMEKIKGEGEKILYLKEESKSSETLFDLENQTESEKRKLKGDYYLKNNQCQNALIEYYEILSNKEELSEEGLGNLWNNIGVAYGKLFLYHQAAKAFQESYKHTPGKDIVFNYFCTCCLLGKMEMPKEWEDYQPETRGYQELEERYQLIFRKHQDSEAKRVIREAIENRSRGKILKSHEILDSLLNQWKKEYRDETI